MTVLSFFLMVFSGVTGFADEAWPRPAPIEKRWTIEVTNAYLRLPILSQDGKLLYTVECANPQTASARGIDFDYSGDFECRLFSDDKGRDKNLLTYEASGNRHWTSRGRFLLDDLFWPSCREYPEYGRVRNFRLRGMHLRFELHDLKFSTNSSLKTDPRKHLLKSFTLRISVKPDPTATNAIEGPNKYLQPPAPDYDKEFNSHSCGAPRLRKKPKHLEK